MPDIPTEALEAAEYAALARKRHSQDVRGEDRSWLTSDEMEQVRAAIRAAAPHLIAEGRRQAAAAIRAEFAGTPDSVMGQAREWAARIAERTNPREETAG